MKLCISSTVYFRYSPRPHGDSTCKLCTVRFSNEYYSKKRVKKNSYYLMFKQAFPLACFKDKNKLNKLNQTNLPQKIKQNSSEWKS